MAEPVAEGLSRAFSPVLRSVLTCPHCGHKSAHEMATDSCRAFEVCDACNAMIRPKAGDCCVFCSHGDAPCPPIQEARACGKAAACCSC